LQVIPGYLCNLKCAHCGTNSGPAAAGGLTEDEILRVEEAVRTIAPANLLFTGGEPTLYTDTVNRVVAAHPHLGDCSVQITTNGWFARSRSSMATILGRFQKLDRIQLSHDRHHGATSPADLAGPLKAWCDERGLHFNVSVSITTPEDMLFADSVQRETGANVIFTRVENAGRAKQERVAFPFQRFERKVEDAVCPNRGVLSYICGKGFSICCANLTFNNVGKFHHATAREHLQSEFYREMAEERLGSMARKRGIDAGAFLPEHSSPCGYCERLHA